MRDALEGPRQLRPPGVLQAATTNVALEHSPTTDETRAKEAERKGLQRARRSASPLGETGVATTTDAGLTNTIRSFAPKEPGTLRGLVE